MRTGQSEKQTMATADAGEASSNKAKKNAAHAENKVAKSLKLRAVAAQEEERGPFVPHVGFARSEIDRQWPSLEAVEDTNFKDLFRLEDEQLYGAVMTIVQGILNEMALHGRTRKPTPDAQPGLPAQMRAGTHLGD